MPFTDQDPIAPLENLLNQAVAEANAHTDSEIAEIAAVRQIQTFRRATLAELNAVAGAVDGDQGYVTAGADKGQYMLSGGDWVRSSSGKWASFTTGSTSTIGVPANLEPLAAPAACSVSVTLAEAATVLVTALCSFESTTSLSFGIKVEGATTVNVVRGGPQATPAGQGSVTHTQYVALNAGTSIIHVAAAGAGSGGTRTVSNPGIIVELI